ncbi:MAG: DMT family transporter [Candidatus Competibacterales bacterium]
MNEATAPPLAKCNLGAAVVWMAFSIVSFAFMAVAGRELSAELWPHEIMVYRSAIGLVVVAGVVWAIHGRLAVASGRPGEHAVRNVVHFAGQNAWLYAIATIPLAQMQALELTSPIWMAVLAPLLLGERITRPGVIAAGLGFVGVLVVTRPGLSPLALGHGAALAAAVSFALTNLVTKRLAREDTTLTILFWMNLTQMVLGLLCTLPAGGPTLFSAALVPWVLAIGLSGLSAHFSLTRALASAPIAIVAPLDYLRLPALAFVGALFYSEALEVVVFLGAGLIIAGNLYNLWAGRP